MICVLVLKAGSGHDKLKSTLSPGYKTPMELAVLEVTGIPPSTWVTFISESGMVIEIPANDLCASNSQRLGFILQIQHVS